MSSYYVGIDLGGTTVKLGLFSDVGELLDKWEIPTRKEDDGKHILPDIVESIEEKMSSYDGHIKGIGMGLPGPVTEDGVVKGCVNLGWGTFDVKNELASLTGVGNIKVGNDANVAALGEIWKGGGRGFDSIVMVTIGTGVGGGIIQHGKIVSGSSGAAGEIGHMKVKPGAPEVCGCGGHGCLECYTSATGIARMAKGGVVETKNTLAGSYLEGKEITAKDVFDGAKENDAYCLEIVENFGYLMGVGLANIASVVDPEAFVIGGGVSKAGQMVIDAIENNYNDNVMNALKNKQFRLAELGNDAGIYGAVRQVLICR
ncbi:MAG: ROK family glucokinase [Eubacterium sp.]|nr:ROK family glucokinase [Eubacterium sp.]